MRIVTLDELVLTARRVITDGQLTLNVNSGYDQCQLQCKYCAVRPFNTRDFKEMTEEELKTQLEFANNVLPRGLKHVHFFGREPLMSPHLIEKTRELMPNVRITITTNGIALQQDRHVRDMLKRANAFVTILSIDGPYQNEHRPMRGGGSSLETVLKAFQYLDDYKDKYTAIRATYMPGESLVEYFRFQRDTLKFPRITPMPDIHTSMFDSKDVEEKVRELADYFGDQDPPSESYKNYLLELEGKKRKRRAFCSIGMLAIGPGLNVYACHHQPDDVKIANIKECTVYDDNIRQILNARAMTVDNLQKCSTCENRLFCPTIGPCVMQFLKEGNILEPNESFCEFSKGFAHGCFYWVQQRSKRKLSEVLQCIH